MRQAVIVATARTPLAKSYRGSFNLTRPDDLAAHAITAVLDKVPALDRRDVEEVILGCGQPHGPAGHNVARVAALRAGLPVTTAGLTVNRYCNSGLQAIVQAFHMVQHEGADVVVGGGVESITMMDRDDAPNPWLQERLPSLYLPMGQTAEVVARRYGISRQQQDEYALISQQRTASAQRDGFFAGEIVPIAVRRARIDAKTGERLSEEEAVVDQDECNRPETTLAGLAKLPPAFDVASGDGTVTAGNSSGITDGAAALVLGDESAAEEARGRGVAPIARILDAVVVGVDPAQIGRASCRERV